MDNTLLEIRDLSVIYKTDNETVRAINGISLELREGETLGIVGETGAGKTTTALSILRLLPERTGRVTGGSIVYKGRDLLELEGGEMRPIRGNDIAMIFQDPMTALNPIMTVGQQIGEALVLHNEDTTKAEVEERVDQVLRHVGISPERKKDYPHQFSGGMKQRVVIAMALACEPDLLIADEPTTALDVTIQAQVLNMIKELRDRLGTAMIMITHDLGIIARTCDKVAIMYAGEFVESGTLEDILLPGQHHPYTVGLFGAIPNLKAKSKRLSPIAGLMPDPTNLPVGCHFSPRCPHCSDVCLQRHPVDWTQGTHRIKCNLFSEVDHE